ncbi:hypothetical protein M413DRAFT_143964 [Hebeloma cylindrosporum]|uniref:Uncharacterized protein n=1 Tax=Hebeloma cylindrosporum TaxID=76867 RepID=A0A0C3CEM8_HEBCY|nr:hypothetical protein M413DRAFT_143964 [Hebeloma cylindrosporum h7]
MHLAFPLHPQTRWKKKSPVSIYSDPLFPERAKLLLTVYSTCPKRCRRFPKIAAGSEEYEWSNSPHPGTKISTRCHVHLNFLDGSQLRPNTFYVLALLN